ncbi:hypothetical protein AGMMS49983_05650 [Clostridia bacterium]|nr:hypothetical protein AGMMS49983_05650 [Clostridia bacterium]
MHISPEMLKDYLLSELKEVRVYGNSKVRYKDLRLPEEGAAYEKDHLYLMTPTQFGDAPAGISAIVPKIIKKVSVKPETSLICAACEPSRLSNLVRACFTLYGDVFQDLYASFAGGASLEEILEKCTPILKNPFFVDDSSYCTLARLRNYPTSNFRDSEYHYLRKNGHHSADYIFAMLNSSVSVESSAISPRPIIHKLEFLTHRSLYSTIKVDGEIAGFFSCIEIDTPFTPGTMDICEILTEFLSHVLAHQANMPQVRQKSLDNDLFLGILSGSIVDPELTRAAFLQAGLTEGDYFVVYVVTNVNVSENTFLLPRLMELLISNLDGGFAVADGSNIILVINAKLDDARRDRLVHLLTFYLGEFDVTIGFSLGFTDPKWLPTYCGQAMAATRLGVLNGVERKVYGYGDVALYDVLEKYGDRAQRLAVCHPAVFVLLAHDREKKMDLFPTLKGFVECLGDTAVAAERLFLHRNSLYYRLKQINALTGIDLTDERVRSHITLSIRILEINGEL